MITFSVESDGNMVGTGTTISQDSSVFTITADSEGGNGVAGNFTLTFKATDQIAVDNEDLSFSLTFSNVVDSSAETILLLKGEGNSTSNLAITYQNSSDASTGFTETNQPYAGTFSPYRSGGYSVYFDGTGDYIDYGTVSAIGNVGTSDFTFEAWFYNEDFNQANFPTIFAINSYTNGLLVRFDHVGPGQDVDVYIANSSRTLSYTFNENEWYHMILTRESGTVKMWINGEYQSSFTGTLNGSITSGNIRIGTSNHTPAETWQGYITDVRFVNGTAEQTGTSNISVPTERLTLNGAELFTCHLPYITDAAGNATPTLNGNPLTQPFGPYDYEPWVGDTHGGSVFFDGGDDMTAFSLTSIAAGNYTVEFWCYPDLDLSTQQTILHFKEASGNGGTNIWFGGSSGENIRVDNGLQGQSSFTGEKLILESWNHVAITRNSTTTTCYINGKSAGSHTYTPNASNRLTIGGFNGQYRFYGYIADVRYVPGSVVYTSAFTPPTAPLGHITNTNLLMNNKSDINMYDMSGSVNLGPSGGVVTNNTTRKFDTSSSIYFDGTDDHLVISAQDKGPWHRGEPFEYGDWTVEAWINQTSGNQSGYRTFFGSSNSGGVVCSINNGTNIVLNRYGFSAPSGLDQSHTFTAGTWYHVAFTRAAGMAYIHVDGVLKNSGGTSFTTTITDRHYNIGAAGSSSINNNPIQEFAGYIQNLRVSRIARYGNSNFTPPTAEFEL